MRSGNSLRARPQGGRDFYCTQKPIPQRGRQDARAGAESHPYWLIHTHLEYVRYADGMVILVAGHPRHDGNSPILSMITDADRREKRVDVPTSFVSDRELGLNRELRSWLVRVEYCDLSNPSFRSGHSHLEQYGLTPFEYDA